jgi:hypothetical protein
MNWQFPRLPAFFFLFLPLLSFAQGSIIRGNVYDEDSGQPIAFASVALPDQGKGVFTDQNGFFSFPGLPAGNYRLVVTFLGYETQELNIELAKGSIAYRRISLKATSIELEGIDVSGSRSEAREQVLVSKISVLPQQIKSLPSVSGESDISQYLTVLPGVISSGDQGGQLYIRGGSPVQNKILLDGLPIFNPFHSIGLFSVIETETIRNVDVYTGGYNAEYGGRISAVVDIKTREGNKKRLGGLVAASPFQAKALIEGPIKPLKNDQGSSVSFLFTGKTALIDRTSPQLYPYAVDTNFYAFARKDTSLNDLKNIGLPYRYTDLYGKLSFNGDNGSKFDVFGFNFSDRFNFPGFADLNWSSAGGGTNFLLIPPNSNLVMNGTVGFSNYNISLAERDGRPRQSGIVNYNANLNFTYYGLNNQFNYGIEYYGFNTDFRFRNLVGLDFQQQDFTTELAGYLKWRQELGNLVLEPGFRIHYYASQSRMSLEPRLGLKWNATDFLRFKAAGGIYAQNLIGTTNDLDVVNFFVGFLAGPEEQLFKPGTRTQVDHRLQKAWHAILGVELDLGKNLSLNVEPYLKNFPQLININRNKLNSRDPDYIVETGLAKGVDLTLRYQKQQLQGSISYSLAVVTRDDGQQEYPTSFDRRHNLNALLTHRFGAKKAWESSLRWNLGSGFPFTQTQGFYQNNNFEQLLLTDVLTGNFPIGILLSGEINGGRLPWYHRLDASIKRTFDLGKYADLETTFSVTNAYNRDNVFYVDRLSSQVVRQFPILPAIAMAIKF